MRARALRLSLAAAGLAMAGTACTDDTGGSIDVPGGTAPLREGVTTAVTGAAGGSVRYVAGLTGAAEAPKAGDPDGSGSARVTIDAGKACVTLVLQNISAHTLAHIHRAAAGVAGPVVVNFGLAAPATEGCGSIDQPTVDAIAADPAGFYVNVHTGDFPDGAIRGQLSRET